MKTDMNAVALGIGQFVISFYGAAPQGALLRVQREPFVTRFECSIPAGEPRQLYAQGYALEDHLLHAAQFDVAIREGARMGERLVEVLRHASQPSKESKL